MCQPLCVEFFLEPVNVSIQVSREEANSADHRERHGLLPDVRAGAILCVGSFQVVDELLNQDECRHELRVPLNRPAVSLARDFV